MMYIELFLNFFKTGLFAIGGGLATLPFLYEMAENYPWFTAKTVTDMLAISESTPGPIGVNMATFAGFTAGGLPGALIATLALVLPALIITLVLASFMKKFRENKLVNDAFISLRPAVVALVLVAFFRVLSASVLHVDAFSKSGKIADALNIPALLLMVGVFAVSQFFKKLHPIVLIGIGALCGIVFGL